MAFQLDDRGPRALEFSLIANHPFVDANERIGHAALEVFLMLHVYETGARAVAAVYPRTPRRGRWGSSYASWCMTRYPSRVSPTIGGVAVARPAARFEWLLWAHRSGRTGLGDRSLRLGSASLQRWLHHRTVELDRIEAAHRAVGGSRRGRRWATGHINQAYVVLLSSHFQGFCRDLHSECIDRLARSVTPTALQSTLRSELFSARKLDRGNPTPGNIGSDFNRLGVSFWPEMRRRDILNRTRQSRLDELSRWRNAVAHQDFPLTPTPHFVTMRTIRSWRRACDALARSSDAVMRDYLTEVTGLEPW